MTKKKVLLALAAAGLLSLGSVAPVLAQDDPNMPADDGAGMDVPADPDSMDPGVDEGAGDGSGMEGGDGMESGGMDSGGEPQPE